MINDVIAQFNKSENECCEVWEENALSFSHFLQIQTQWKRLDGSGVVLGLDYASVIAYLNLFLSAEQVKEVFIDIQVMEFAALPILNAKKEG